MSTQNNLKATAVILGGTGDLGYNVSTIFLTEYRETFPTVRVTTRDPTSTKAQELKKKGAEIFTLGESFEVVLAGADVVINVMPGYACVEINKDLIDAMLKTKVKVYFPSEFGLENKTLYAKFPGIEHPEWRSKRAMYEELVAATHGALKIVRVSNGGFPSWLLTPHLSFCANVPANTYTALGDPATPFTVTALPDIGRAVARLAALALDPATTASVREDVRIAGATTSVADLRDLVARVRGVEKGTIEVGDVATVRAHIAAHQPATLMDIVNYIRVLVAEGAVDLSEGSANELVNPGESLWKWRTVEDELRAL